MTVAPRSAMSDTPSRRDFCVGLTLLSVAGLLPACGGSSTSPSGDAPMLPTINASVATGKIALTINASSPLNAVGSAALVQTSSGSFLVAQTAAGSFTALTATCTHEQCTVTGFQSPQYVCPCHGSRYSTSGAVVQGPAPRALQSFATVFANGVLTITVA